MNEKIEQTIERMYGKDLDNIAEYQASIKSLSERTEAVIMAIDCVDIMIGLNRDKNALMVITDAYMATLKMHRMLAELAEKHKIERAEIMKAVHESIVAELNEIEEYEIGI